MLDVVALLGEGWTIDDSATVEQANQMSMAMNLPDVCDLRQLATFVPSSSLFAPPVGWTVYWVSRAAGYGAMPLKLEDQLWVSPQGLAYSVTSCTQAMIDGEQMQVVAAQPKKTSHLLLMLGGVGLLAWLTFSK